MGYSYAGILGPIAFATIIARGVMSGGDLGATIRMASLSLFAFAMVGFAIGQIADTIISTGVRRKLLAELAENDKQNLDSPSATEMELR